MKHIIAFCFLSFHFYSFAQNEPIPISENGIWIEGSGSWDPFGNFVYNTPTGLMITDTVYVNDTLYLELTGFEYCNGGTLYGQTFLLREDSGKYFYKHDTETEEKLWFDFTLEVGDTINLDHCYSSSAEQEQLTVISIETVTLGNGSERRKWTLEYSDNQSGFYLTTEEWIEGIGNVQQGWRHPTAQTCIDIGHWLRCYYENDEWVESFEFIAPGTTCCNIVSVLEQGKMEYTLYPNPATEGLTIQSSLIVTSVEISDTTGRIVCTTQPNTTSVKVNIESLSTGCYFVVATTENGIIETLKFLKD